MSAGFAFQRQPQGPAPDPRAVGRALAQQGMGGIQGGAPPGMPAEPDAADHLLASAQDNASHAALLARLRAVAGERAGGGGATGAGSGPPDDPEDEAGLPAHLTQSLADSYTRMGGGATPSPIATPERSARRRAQLLASGFTPLEIELLERSQAI
jgi:hypothetical protein